MSHVLDLDAYRRRIGHSGSFEPTFGTLDAILRHHTSTIPFENLTVLLGQPVVLDTASLERKLVHERRGGYCFEQNGFLLALLQQIGFEAHPLGARVRMGVGREVLPPRTHVFVKVVLDGTPWMADVGVGGLSLTTPIRLDHEGPQDTPHETRRILREDSKHYHQALIGEEWTDVHEFGAEEMPMVDRELANWWTSTNPTSRFHNMLICARADGPNTRLSILNDRFTKRVRGEAVEDVRLDSADHILAVLRDRFGLEFPPGTRFGWEGAPWPRD